MNGILSVIREIHRRSLWQVLGVYLVGSWIGYQVILAITQGVGLPSWVPAFSIVLFIIGLPVVLATAIVQEAPPVASAEVPAAGAAPSRPPAPEEPGPGRVLSTSGLPKPGRGSLAALLTWRRTMIAGVLAFVLLAAAAGGYTGMRLLGVGPVGTLMARGMLDEQGRIVLADFHNSTSDADLGAVVTSALRIDLVQSPTVTVADPEVVREVVQRMGRDPAAPLTPEVAREVALREGIEAVLAGEIAMAGAGYLLTATLVAADGGATLEGFRETARDAAALIDAIDRLSRQVRERVGEPLRSVRRTEPLARVTTESLEALRLYAQALRLGTQDGDYVGAVQLLDEAVALDEDFAAAYLALASNLANTRVQRARIVDAATRAYELRDRLTPLERDQATARYFQVVVPDRDRVIRAYEAILERNPGHRSSLNNLALALRAAGQYERAEQLLRQAAEAGQWAGHYANLVRVITDQGRHEEARELADTAWRLFEGHPVAYELRIMAAAGSADWHRALEYATAMYEAAGSNRVMRAHALLARSHLLDVLGRWSDADRSADEARSIAEDLGLPATALSQTISRAYIRAGPWVQPDAAVAAVEADLARFPLDAMGTPDRPYTALTRFYTRAGRLAEAEHYLDRFTSAATARGGDPPAVAHRLRGALATRQGRPQEALELFARVERDPGGCRICHLPELGLAYEAAARPDSAIAAYERYLTTPNAHREQVDATHRAVVLVRLADLHEDTGNRAAAAVRLSEFIELWRDADPELQPHVENARRRLAALVGEGVETSR